MALTTDSQEDGTRARTPATPDTRITPVFEPVARPANLVVFGFDSAEVSQIRRIRSLIALGHHVQAFTMRRGAGPVTTDFPNVHLCFSAHEKLGQRMVQVALSVFKTLGHRAYLRKADLIIARNLDMLAVAWAARFLAGRGKVPLVYECLDIHRAMVDPGLKGRLMRWAERWLLACCQMLAVSSPAYRDAYFAAYQGYHGPVALWENKVIPTADLTPRPDQVTAVSDGPVRLGWVGAIRCAPSLKLLIETAEAMGDRIEIHIHGLVQDHALPDFAQQIATRPNIFYHGAYTYPQDLAAVYGHLDLVWNIDLWLRGGNSEWALSNRLYEAGYYGCPSLALAGTATAARVQSDDLGWILPDPDVEVLTALLDGVSRADLHAASQRILALPKTRFEADGSDLQEVVQSLTSDG